jgi:hypothetical protein
MTPQPSLPENMYQGTQTHNKIGISIHIITCKTLCVQLQHTEASQCLGNQSPDNYAYMLHITINSSMKHWVSFFV